VIREVAIADLDNIQKIFKGSQLDMVRAAIVSGNTAGRMWHIKQNDSRPSIFLWDQGNNVFYLGGDTLLEAGAGELAALISGEIRTQSLAEGARYFRARGLTPALHAQVGSLFATIKLEAVEERYYGYPDKKAPARQAAQKEVVIRSLDRNLLESDSQNLDQVTGEIAWMWPGSRDDAIERFATHGFGSVAMIGRRIVCWCTAEYVSADRCGIGIETVEDCQRQGIATATAAHFIGTALDRGTQPFWECYSENVPSVRLANRLGFQLLETAAFWAGLFPSLR
jgi:GNAT superfamily N-acetyltransferase